MTDKTKTVLVGDLKVGDTIRITQEVVVEEITDLNKKTPTKTKKLVLLKGTAVEGGWRETKGEFVISKTEKVERVKRAKSATWYDKVAGTVSDWLTAVMIAALASGAVVIAASTIV